jgi:phosphoribosylformylglycinamidine synthase
VRDVARIATVGFKAAGEQVLVIGATKGWLGQSLYLRDICGREEGAPPPVDLAAEKRNGDFVRSLIAAGRVTAVHDISDGGMAVALAEMAMAGGIGVEITESETPRVIASPPPLPRHALYFGEDQGRYVVTCRPADMNLLQGEAGSAGVPTWCCGVTGGDSLTLPGEAPILLADLVKAHEAWFPAYMAAVD